MHVVVDEREGVLIEGSAAELIDLADNCERATIDGVCEAQLLTNEGVARVRIVCQPRED